MGAAGRAARGGAQHLPADAAARPQHGRLHAVPDGGDRRLRRRRRRRPASTSSGSSTRSTTSSRCGRRSTRCARPAPPSPRSRSATPATSPTPPRSSTRSTTTCAWPSRSSTPAPTSGDQGHGRAAARAGRAHAWSPRCASASTCRCTCTPTTPPAASSPRCSRRSTPGVDAVDAAARLDGRHHLASRALSALVVGHRPHRPRDRARPRGRLRAGALLGGDAPGLRAVRVGAARADRPGLPPRDPRRPALQPAPAGDRARPRREVRADRGHVRRGQRHPRQRRQGHPVVQGGRRPGARTWSRVGADPAEFAEDPGRVRHPRLGDRLPHRRARRPARRLARAVPHQGARRAAPGSSPPPSSPPSEQAGLAGPDPAASTHAQRAALPRPDQGVRRRSASSTATCRCCRPSTTSTACARARSTRVELAARASAPARPARRSASPTSAASAP